MSKSDVGNIEEIFISPKDKKENDIFALQQRVLKKYIDSRIDEIEESFKILCDEFDELFTKKRYILVNRDFYYINQISSFIPNLSKFKLYSESDSDPSIKNEEYLSFEEFMQNSPNEDEIRKFLKYNNISPKLLKDNIDNNLSVNILFYFLKNRIRPKAFKDEKTKSICELLNVLYKKNSEWFTLSGNSIVFKDKDDVKKYFYEKAKEQEFYFLPEIDNFINGNKIEADDEFIENFTKELLNSEYDRCSLKKMNFGILTGKDSGHWDLFDYNKQRKEDCVKIVTVPKDKEIHFKDPHKSISDNQVAIDFGTKSTVVSYLNESNQFIPVKLSGEGISVIDKDSYENPTIMHFKNFCNFVKDYEDREGRPNTKWKDLTVAHEAFNELDDEKSKFESFFIDLKSWCASNKNNRIKDEKGYKHEFIPFLELSKSETEFNPVEYYAYFLGLYINNMSETNNIFMNYKLSFPITFKDELRKAIIKSFRKGIKKSLPTSILSDENFEEEFFVEEGLREPVAYAITALEKYHFNERVRNGETCYYAVFDFGGGTTDFDFGIYSKIDKNDPDYGIYYYKISRLGDGGVPNLGGEKLLKYLAFEVFKTDLNFTLRNKEDNKEEDSEETTDENQDEENNNIIPFTTYDGCKEDEYSEIGSYVIDDSTSAKKNMSKLMEKLRWVWEKPYSQTKQHNNMRKSLERGVVIDKFGYLDDNNIEKVKQRLRLIKNDEEESYGDYGDGEIINLPILLRKKIEEGIDEFFNSLLAKFRNSPIEHIDEISIFLAGNSTKSILFNIILSEYLGNDYDLPRYYKDIVNNKCEECNSDSDSEQEENKCSKCFFRTFKLKQSSNDYINNIKKQLGNENLKFVVYPPLKTKEAKEKLQSMGYNLDLSKQTEPSGKTGVAYGMLVDRVLVEEVKMPEGLDVAFQYYVGVDNSEGTLDTVICSGDGCGKGFYAWKKLCPASSKKKQYMLYYTDSAKADGNNMPIDSNTPHRKIRPPQNLLQDRTAIFIRALEPNVIQWQVADSIENCKDLDENVNRIILID